jgi:hypothetical protein
VPDADQSLHADHITRGSSGHRAVLALALVAGDVQHVALADYVAEDDRAVAGHRAYCRVDTEGASAVS